MRLPRVVSNTARYETRIYRSKLSTLTSRGILFFISISKTFLRLDVRLIEYVPPNKCTRRRWPKGSEDSLNSKPKRPDFTSAATSVSSTGSDRRTDSRTRCRSFSIGVREETSGWAHTRPSSVDSMPPVPTDPQELEGWLSHRNCDLRNAIEFGNPELIDWVARVRNSWSCRVATNLQRANTDKQSSRMRRGCVKQCRTVHVKKKDARDGFQGVRVALRSFKWTSCNFF